jgi:hypothetical protein
MWRARRGRQRESVSSDEIGQIVKAVSRPENLARLRGYGSSKPLFGKVGRGTIPSVGGHRGVDRSYVSGAIISHCQTQVFGLGQLIEIHVNHHTVLQYLLVILGLY